MMLHGSYCCPKIGQSNNGTDWKGLFAGLAEDVSNLLDETGLELPGWMDDFRKMIPGQQEPEVSETPDEIMPVVEDQGFVDKYGKIALIGGIALGAIYLLKKKK